MFNFLSCDLENLCQDQELDQLTAVLEAEVTIQPDSARLEVYKLLLRIFAI